jgi:hypothetical protein
MTIAEYLLLPDGEKVQYQSHRHCSLCEGVLVRETGHSTGNLHVVCPSCNFCPDCDEGE